MMDHAGQPDADGSTRTADAVSPALSVVLVTSGGFEEIRVTMRRLAAQTIADRLEVLIVAANPGNVQVPAALSDALHGVRLVGVPSISPLATAKAAAVPHAAAPYVAFAEDHSFPEPEWAAAIVAAHDRGYGGVAPEMKNGNPDNLLSWAAMFLHFGTSVEPGAGFEADYPGASHNMSYRRDALLALGPELGRRMLAEGFLHDAIRAQGHKLWVEPGAATHHVNIGYLGALLRHAWIGGRLYGALRYGFGNWSFPRRVVYAGGSPLIPIIRLRRTLREIRRAGYSERLMPRVLLPMSLILLVHAAGEATGYLLGIGSTERQYSLLEVGRDRLVPPSDLKSWT